MSARAEEIAALIRTHVFGVENGGKLVWKTTGAEAAATAILALPPEGGEADTKGKEVTTAIDELAAIQEVWADISREGGIERLIERASSVKDQLRRVAENGYTRGKSENICEDAAFAISQLTTALARRAATPEVMPEGGEEKHGRPTGIQVRQICEALGFDPTNHHNAARCPYCTLDSLASTLAARDAEIAKLKADKARMGEALAASEGIEPLRMELEDCLPNERKALERELKKIQKLVSSALKESS